MANFNFHNADYVDSTVYIKITKPSADQVWKTAGTGANTFVSNAAGGHTEAQTTTDVAWNALSRGYPVTLPTALPMGEYDLLFFFGTSAAAAEADPYIAGFGFKWDGQQLIGPPTARLTSRVE